MKSIYKKLVRICKSLDENKNIAENHVALAMTNRKLYNDKKKLKEHSYGSPPNKSTFLLFYIVSASIVFSIIRAFANYYYIKIVYLILLLLGLIITIGTVKSKKFKNSPIVWKSLYHRIFIGGTNTKWYSFDCELVSNMYMDIDKNNQPSPIMAYFILFIPKTEEDINKGVLTEITEEEFSMYKKYVFDTAAVAVCDKDVVEILFYKEGEEYIEALQKISQK